MLIDTHCHLNIVEAFPIPSDAMQTARAAGVDGLIVVGIDVETSRIAVELANRENSVWAVVGIHPNSSAAFQPAWLAEIEKLASDRKVVAIGEVGLDYHWDYATPPEQARALHGQLDLAADLGLPVVFHCREAYDDLLAVLQARPARPYLLHCFSGSLDQARAFAELGAIFGVDGPITFKSAQALREIVRELGPDRWVLETDSPYLSPEPFRGKPNSPARLPWIARAFAATLGLTEAEAIEATGNTAKRFFRI